MDWTIDDVVLLLASFVLPVAFAALAVHWPYRRRRRSRHPPND
jgi:hypothetical protein